MVSEHTHTHIQIIMVLVVFYRTLVGGMGQEEEEVAVYVA